MVKTRRKAREAALRALYQIEVSKGTVAAGIAELDEYTDLDDERKAFARELVEGVHKYMEFLDGLLERWVQDYEFHRLAVIDKNLLRIGAYELFYCADTPPAVSISEVVQIAKKYSTAESGKFVNGVLGGLLYDSPKAEWDPSEHPVYFEEPAPSEPSPEIEQLDADSPEAKELGRAGGWKIRSEDKV